MIKIVVSTMQEKKEVLEAIEHIHDSNIDTSIPMVNTIAHIYLAPYLVEIDDGKVC